MSVAMMLALLVLGASGGSQPPSRSKIDACRLVTKAEVEKAIGTPVTGEPTASSFGPMDGCRFDVAVGGIRGMWSLQLMSCSPATFKALATIVGNAQPVSGAGDEASWNGDNLTVRKGNHCLTIPKFGDAMSLAAAKTLAGEALGRLPQ